MGGWLDGWVGLFTFVFGGFFLSFSQFEKEGGCVCLQAGQAAAQLLLFETEGGGLSLEGGEEEVDFSSSISSISLLWLLLLGARGKERGGGGGGGGGGKGTSEDWLGGNWLEGTGGRRRRWRVGGWVG